jgi:hypothetical protein
MDEPEVARLGLPSTTRSILDKSNLEERVVVAFEVIDGPGGELLIGGHQRRSDVMSEKMGLGIDVVKLDDISMVNNASFTSLRDGLGGDDFPEIVGIIVAITSDLLTCKRFDDGSKHIGLVLTNLES